MRIAGKGDGTQTAVWVDLRSSQNNIYSSTLSLAGPVAHLRFAVSRVGQPIDPLSLLASR